MSPVQEMKDGRGKCIFYGSLPQETGGLTPMGLTLAYRICHMGVSPLNDLLRS